MSCAWEHSYLDVFESIADGNDAEAVNDTGQSRLKMLRERSLAETQEVFKTLDSTTLNNHVHFVKFVDCCQVLPTSHVDYLPRGTTITPR